MHTFDLHFNIAAQTRPDTMWARRHDLSS